MNRAERRKKIKQDKNAIGRSNMSKENKEIFKKMIEDAYKKEHLEEGTRVKIKADNIRERAKELPPKFEEFLKDNEDKVFTVEYEEKYAQKKLLACLKEDTTEPKWLFWESDLEPVVESEE